MMIFSAATLVCGAVLYGLGALQWAKYFRFVPYFVVGGFLAVTGWFLVAGGIRMTIGRSLQLSNLGSGWTAVDIAKLASALATLAVLLALHRRVKSPFAMPAALLAMWAMGATALRSFGISGSEQGWYFHSLGSLASWSPFSAGATQINWWSLATHIPDMLAVTIVAHVWNVR